MRKTWPDPLSQMDHREQRTQKTCVMRAGHHIFNVRFEPCLR
ncbi:hypothetical protein BN77_2305 [Rhizobium mesoamericanum STM3625]|uniref:Uncharacterized protein n=1 Tax=Rhizobium mesoamericanum STM3625 TaxID=1211777 RepID=K0PVH0_9HYPH|nr:hypothetical protein BN77_2305 [Rhizobium mesoamericanum STM3625]